MQRRSRMRSSVRPRIRGITWSRWRNGRLRLASRPWNASAQIRAEFEGADVVYRIHGDRASELTGTLVKEHFAKKKVVVTSTPGFEADANGRAEKGVGLTKLRARAMLLSFENIIEDRQAVWPMGSMRHGVAAWRRKGAK